MAERGSYEVGTRVRFTEEDEGFEPGDIATVTRDDADGVPQVEGEDGRIEFVNEDSFDVIDDVKKTTTKFKVGDRVRVTRRTGNTSGLSPYCNTREFSGIVKEVGSFYNVHSMSDEYAGLFYDDELQSLELHVGQRVRVHKPGSKGVNPHYWNSSMDDLDGNTYTIRRVGATFISLDEPGDWSFQPEWLEPVEATTTTTASAEPLTTNDIKEAVASIQGESPMSNVLNDPIRALRETISDDTAILRRANMENIDGTPTGYAKDAMIEELWREKRAGYAAKLRAARKTEVAAEDGKTAAEATEE